MMRWDNRSIANVFNTESAPTLVDTRNFAEAVSLPDYDEGFEGMRQGTMTTLQGFIRQIERAELSSGAKGAGTVRLLAERAAETMKPGDFSTLLNAARVQVQAASDAERIAAASKLLAEQAKKEAAAQAEKDKAKTVEAEKQKVEQDKTETVEKEKIAKPSEPASDTQVGENPQSAKGDQIRVTESPVPVSKNASTPSPPVSKPRPGFMNKGPL